MKTAVRFEGGQLDSLLRLAGTSLRDLSVLTIPAGALSIESYSMEEPPLAIAPLITSGTEIIVGSPGMLAVAARHYLIRLALEHGVGKEVMQRFTGSIWNSTSKLLDLTRHPPVCPCPDTIQIPFSRQGFFSLDTDKLIFVLLVSDTLEGYDTNMPFGQWQSEVLGSKIGEQLKRAEAFAFSHLRGINELICLVLVGGVGRAFFVAFNEGPRASHVLMMPSYDLETILFLEGGNPLALFKFARARDRIRRRADVITDSVLNEYYYFRKRAYSYYMADDFRPNFITLSPGGAGDLRREVMAQRDWHAAPSARSGATVEVMTLHDTSTIPLYAPIESIGRQVALLVEGLPLPVWIVGPEYGAEVSDERELHSEYAQFADAIAYWLWQMTPSIASPISSLRGNLWRVLIELRITQKEEWKRALTGAQANGPPLAATADRENGRVLVTLHPPIVGRCMGPDNQGERVMMTEVLRGLRNLLAGDVQASLSDGAISTILDKHAPLGTEKKIMFVGSATLPELDDTGLPSFRAIQKSDVSDLLDELGDHLERTLHVKGGTVPSDQRVDLLRNVVAFFYQGLQRVISCHASESLVPWLVAHNEAAVRESASGNLTIPTRMACFNSQNEMLALLKEEIPEISSASLAGRFLIEFASAQPPGGLRPISLDSYDRLLATASHIINFGMMSDLIHFKLADIRLSVLPSGRLGTEREALERAQASYLSITTLAHMEWAGERFARHWRDIESKAQPSETIRLLDSAAVPEFGHSITDLVRLMWEASQFGRSIDPVVCSVPSGQLRDQLVTALSWPPEKVSHALRLLTLEKRSDFLNPGPPFNRSDLYPWRFNRSLSYLRRPFVEYVRNGNPEVAWGPRHLHAAIRYLTALCTSGRLRAQSSEMRQLMGRFNHLDGEAFNDNVADLLERYLSPHVRRRVTKIKTRSGNAVPPGDIDVLAGDQTKKNLYVIECKDLALARTPAELSNELLSLFVGHRRKKSTIAKHEAKVEWVAQNRDQVTKWLGFDRKVNWKIVPLVVVSDDLFTPYLRTSKMKVISFRQLKGIFEETRS